ncbi:MAG TPA: serine/threonine-protein kinase, partial [Acidimicrobiales bacterium]
MADGPALTIPGVEGLEEIGRGGMAVVYKGHQPAFSRDVAVKVVVVAGVDERVRRRFEQELQAVGGLSEHPHIISVHGEGVTDQGLPYLIMGFQPGGSLADRLRARGPILWAEVADLGVKMAGALESAHRAGVLHRDVKPENILVSSFGEPVLADFGIARLEGGAHLTASGMVTGTPAHTAPEVMQGQAPTAASDVYGLASTLHQLLAGTPAFVKVTDESTLAVMNRVLSEAPPDLRRGGVPGPLADVIDRGMAKEPAARFATAAQFGQALRGAQQTLGVAVTSLPVALEEGSAPDIGETVVVAGAVAPLAPTPVDVPAPPPPPITPAPYLPSDEAEKKPKWPWILAAAAVVIAAVAAVVLTQGGDDGGDAERFANAPDQSTTTEAPTTTTEPAPTTSPTTSAPPVTVAPPPPSVFGPPVDPATFIPEYGSDAGFDSLADSCFG